VKRSLRGIDRPGSLRPIAVALLLATAPLAAGPALAQPVYRWTDASGEVHFSDRPPPGAAQPVEQVDVAPVPAAPPADDYYSVVNQARRMEELRLERERQSAEIEVLQRQAAPPPEPPRPAPAPEQGASRGIWLAPPVYWGPGSWPGQRPPHRPGWDDSDRPHPGHRPPPDRPRPEPRRPSFSVDTQRR
jgi:hypothetical protein